MSHPSASISWLPSLRTILAFSALLRIALILYSEWHDAHSAVKYTDIDYRVFSDAAKYTYRAPENRKGQGLLGPYLSVGDPYTRETYRYTPLLAIILTPNEWLHPSFGKYVFAACDMINGLITYNILQSKTLVSRSLQPASLNKVDTRSLATLYTAAHLLNPLVFSISTRGSAESMLSTLILLTLNFAMSHRWDAAAVMLGVSAHWKIYPFIYGVPCVAALSRVPPSSGLQKRLQGSFNYRSARFFAVSAGTFLGLGMVCYLIWGYPFLYETYLYHLHRLDHRHNFSPFFYPIYLTYPDKLIPPEPQTLLQSSLRSSLISFVPQMTLVLGQGVLFARESDDLPFTWFTQTVVFVVFNKVCTSQYFLWYTLFLPLLLPVLHTTQRQLYVCLAVWIGSQAIWLSEAYNLEFLGKAVFHGVWLRGVIYVCSHVWVLSTLISGYKGAMLRTSDK
jgi:phosphatidylinositol glycan class M